MARNREVKIGIDYFSHDTDIMQDTKIKLLKAKHGLLGYAIYLRLLEELYRETGYYLQLNEDVNILFCDDNNLEYNAYILVLNDCIDRELFDKKLYDKYGILTSKRIQFNYISATERRKEVTFFEEYLLVNVTDFYDQKKVDVNILSLNVDISRQRKEKVKQIEKESKEDNIYSEVINYLNQKTNSKYKVTDTHKTHITARTKEGATLEDFKTVIDKKHIDWQGTQWEKFLRPQTLFGTKFDSYLNEKKNRSDELRGAL